MLTWSDDEQDVWRREALQRAYSVLHEREERWAQQVECERAKESLE